MGAIVVMDNVVQIETSARHVHLTQQDFAALFGDAVELTAQKSLSQPGMFCARQRVTIVGPRGRVANVAIVGPLRRQTQVEISATDAIKLGINPPVRESGQLKGSAGCEILVPESGRLKLMEGVIIAKRHLHLSIYDADKMKITDGETVCVKVITSERSLVFGDVVARISANFVKMMHVDVDEANAAGLFGIDSDEAELFGEVINKKGDD
jgi:putative phosphotransacetylase